MKSKLKVTLIAAVSDDGFISVGSGMPWDLPEDKEHFRQSTAGKWLLVGRKTFEEMKGWFRDDQHVLVLSKRRTYRPSVGIRVASVNAAVKEARRAGTQELMVIGGGATYAWAMPHASNLDVTRVHVRLGIGVPFPLMGTSKWRLVGRRPHPADDQHAYAFTFTKWEKIGPERFGGVNFPLHGRTPEPINSTSRALP